MAKQVQGMKPTSNNPKMTPAILTSLSIALIVFTISMFFSEVLFSKKSFLGASDNISAISFEPYLQQYRSSQPMGDFPLWLPNIFSGMPGYAALLVTGERRYDFITYTFFEFARSIGKIGGDEARIIFYYTIYAIGLFLLMRSKKLDYLASITTAIAGVLSTWVIAWIMIGHSTKPVALCTFPFILMALENLRDKFTLRYTALLVIAMRLLIESTHVQMIFYGAIAFGTYLIFDLIARTISKQNPLGVLRSGLLLASATAISFAMSSDRFLSTMEYTPYSTRGTSPIEVSKQQGGGKGNSATDVNGGFDYGYATNWSFSPGETMTFLVPNYFGFGKLKATGEAEQLAQENGKIGTYWGQMPFTDAAYYMGIGILLLAVIGVAGNRSNVFVLALTFVCFFALVMSFGKNFSIPGLPKEFASPYNIFFYFVPSFNKFRAPMLILALVNFATPILAGFGVHTLTRWRNSGMSKGDNLTMKIVAGFAVLWFVIGVLFYTGGESSYIDGISNSGSQLSTEIKDRKDIQGILYPFIFNSAASDWLVCAFFGLTTIGAGWLFAKKKIPTMAFGVILISVTVIDLFRVSSRPMDVTEDDPYGNTFAETDITQFIKQDASTYRVADFTVSAPNIPAYHLIESVHGYHSAKMRVYQDMLDVAGGEGGGGSYVVNPFLWNLLNVKYIVLHANQVGMMGGLPPAFSSQSGAKVFQNPSVLTRAFFVDSVRVADGATAHDKGLNILHHLRDGDFNPRQVAFLEEPLKESITPADSTCTVQQIGKQNEHTTWKVKSTGNHLLFFSEVHYPVSWHCFIDGKEVTVNKTNYVFRSIVVPSGDHVVEWKFTSTKFEQGKTLSLVTNFLVLGLFGAALWEWRKMKSHGSAEATKE